jgi:hypothetical protein
MNDTYVVTAYIVIDDILKAHGYEDDSRASGTAVEKYFQNHHETALEMMTRLGYCTRVTCVTVQSTLAHVRGVATRACQHCE